MDEYHLALLARKLDLAVEAREAWKVRDLLRVLTRGNVAEAEHSDLQRAAQAARRFLTLRHP